MSKGRIRKYNLHWVHLFAVLILVGYFLLSKINIVQALKQENIIVSFLRLYFFGTGFGLFLLYILSHDKFFPIAKEIEKAEEKKEKKYLKKYIHHGKILATFIIGMLGGPIFSSLTARLLLNNTNFLKYFVVILANIPSTFFTMGIANGFMRIFNFANTFHCLC